MLNPLLDNRVNAPESGILNHMLHAKKERKKKGNEVYMADRFRRVLVLLDRVGHRIR